MISSTEQKKLGAVLTQAYYEYSKGLIKYAFRKLNNRSISTDLVQDTFVRVWGYLLKGQKIDKMKSFLYRVLNNLIIDQYRKHKTISLDAMIEEGYEPQEKSKEDIIYTLDAKRVFKLIEYLPESYKSVISMRYLDDFSIKEMSLLTNKSTNSLSIQVHRGLEKLRLLYHA